MTKFDDIYEIAADYYGLITSAQAREVGVSNNELVQYAKRGKLARIGQGAYRLSRYVPTPYDAYAEAVALIGPEAYLYGESVIAMHGLAPTNPTYSHVATPKRVRRSLPSYMRVVQCPEEGGSTAYEGIPSQTVAAAIRSCRGRMMDERLRDATLAARAKGYLTRTEEQELSKESAQELVEPIKRKSDQAAPIAESLVYGEGKVPLERLRVAARETGRGATDDELTAEPRCTQELGDAELDAVAGGGIMWISCLDKNLKN